MKIITLLVSSLVLTWTAVAQAGSGELQFVQGEFDPLEAPEVFNNKLSLQDNETGEATYIIQFDGKIQNSFKSEIRELGAKYFRFLPETAGLVLMDAHSAAKIKDLPYVRWVGILPDHLKADPLTTLESTDEEAASGLFNIGMIDESEKDKVLGNFDSLGATILNRQEGTSYVTAKLSPQQLQQVLGMPEVVWVDRWTSPEFDMDNARIQGGTNFMVSVARNPGGYTGVGIIGHVMEGVKKDHEDFGANNFRDLPIEVVDGDADSHGHATYGIIFGDGTGDETATGLMPNGQGMYTHYKSIVSGSRFDITKQGIDDHHAMFSTASWGSGRTTQYTSDSAMMDEIIFKLDLPITQSQSNASSRQSRPQAWAKNIISIGGIAHKDNADPSDDSWRDGGASIGPAEDGRIKPDLVAYYDAIHTTGLNGYTSFGGTSGATPIVAGHVGLSLEMWTDGIYGNELPVPNGERWENRPHFTTTKAMLINTANQYDFSGEDHDLTRVHQGWGFPSLENLWNNKDNLLIVNEDDVLNSGETTTYEVEVAANTPKLHATMIYADPAAVPNAAITLVNNLDLKVTAPDGTVYHGNVGLLEGNFSQAGGAPNAIDPVENVIVENPQAGTWTVEVTAAAIVQDGHVETANDDADYALVVSGIQK